MYHFFYKYKNILYIEEENDHVNKLNYILMKSNLFVYL